MQHQNIKNHQVVSELCVKCGLCCSGALFATASIESEEADFAVSIGMQVVTLPSEELGFTLRCPHLSGTACRIYEQRRPKICSSFFCKLAYDLDNGDIALEEAMTLVMKAHRLLQEIQPLLEKSESTCAQWLASMNTAVNRDNARLSLLMFVLFKLFDKSFRLQDARMFRSLEPAQ